MQYALYWVTALKYLKILGYCIFQKFTTVTPPIKHAKVIVAKLAFFNIFFYKASLAKKRW